MVPLRLSLSGFMSYNDEQQLSFEDGPLFVLSGPNGAGKSTIFDAITYALYGQTRAERGDGGASLINHGASKLLVRFDFRLDEAEFRIERTMTRAFTRGGEERAPAKTRVVLRRQEDGAWQPVAGTDREDDYERWLRRSFGIDYEAFTTAILLQQGKSEKLLDAKPAERRQILSELIGLSRFEKVHERADALRLDLARQRGELEKRLAEEGEVPEESVAAARASLASAEAAAEQLDKEVRELHELQVHARNFERWRREREDLQREQAAQQSVLGRADEIRGAQRRIEELRRSAGLLGDVVQLDERIHAMQADLGGKRRAHAEVAAAEGAARAALDARECASREHDERREALRERERAVAGELALVSAMAERAGLVRRRRQRCAELKEQLGRLPEDLPAQVAQATLREAELAELRLALPALKQIGATRGRLRAARAAEAAQRDQLAEDERTLAALAEAVAEARAVAERQESAARDLHAARSIAEEAVRQAAERRRRFSEAAQAADCALCGQPIGPAHAARERERLQTAEAAAQAQLDEAATAEAASSARRQQLAEALREWQARHESSRRERDRCAAELEAGRRAQEGLLHDLEAASEHLPERFRGPLGARPADSDYPAAELLASMERQAREAKEHARVLAALREQLEQRRRHLSELERDERELAQLLSDVSEAALFAAAERKAACEQERATLTEALMAAEATLESGRNEARALSERLHATAQQRAGLERQLQEGQSALQTEEAVRRTKLALLPAEWREAPGRELLQQLEAETRRLAPYEELSRLLQEAERGGLAERLGDLEQRLSDTPPRAQRSETEVAAELGAASVRLARDRAQLQQLQGELQALERRRQEHAELRERRDRVAQEHGLHERLAIALGPKGLQRFLLQEAEREIVKQANETLHDLSGGGLWLRLQPDEESKKALDLLVCNRETTDRPMPIAMCSGSQRFRIAISLALSTGRYLSRESRRVESVIIDEGFGCLDRERRAEMVEVLKTLRDRLTRIILVSHQEEFAGRFTQGYRIELRDRCSVVLPLGVA